MNVSRWFPAAALAASLLAPLAAQTRTPAPAPEWYYLPGPPEFVAGTMVASVKWSPDSHYVLAVRHRVTVRSLDDMQMESSIVLWNAETRASTVVWRVAGEDYHVTDVTWMPGTSVAFATVVVNGTDDSRNTLWRIDARRATAAEVAGFGPEDHVTVSPLLPRAVVFGQNVRSLDASGQMGPPLLPAKAVPFPISWSADGASLYLPGVPGDADEKSFWSLDPGTGSATALLERPQFPVSAPVEPKWPFRVDAVEADNEGKTANAVKIPWSEGKLRTLWIVQGEGPLQERTLLTASAREWFISPRGNAILYSNREGCFVAPLIRVDRARMEALRQIAQREMLLNNGKQVALAMMMHAMDHDEVLPPAGTDLRTLLEAYARSPEIFNGLNGSGDGFVYTFGGGSMSEVEDPANTEMGYIPAPGGRAVVFVDGHVVFEPSGAPRP